MAALISNSDRAKKAKLVKWALIGAGCVVAPFVALFILKTLVALVIAGALGIGTLIYGPVLEMKLRNYKVTAVVKEAAKNPIPSMINVLLDKRKAASVYADRITGFRAEINDYKDKMKVLSAKYPEEAVRFEERATMMTKVLEFREGKYNVLLQELDNSAASIEKFTMLWDMGQAALRLNDAAGIDDEKDLFEKLKIDASIDSVNRSLNLAFSQMETALLDSPELKHAQPATLVIENDPAAFLLNDIKPVATPVQIKN